MATWIDWDDPDVLLTGFVLLFIGIPLLLIELGLHCLFR